MYLGNCHSNHSYTNTTLIERGHFRDKKSVSSKKRWSWMSGLWGWMNRLGTTNRGMCLPPIHKLGKIEWIPLECNLCYLFSSKLCKYSATLIFGPLCPHRMVAGISDTVNEIAWITEFFIWYDTILNQGRTLVVSSLPGTPPGLAVRFSIILSMI